MLSDSLLERLKICLEQQTGLDFFGKGWQDFESRIASAAQAAGTGNVREYIDQLLTAPLSSAQISTLARHLTISETYFFRDQHSFDALTEQIFPELIKKRTATDRRLRIWSAGCCTGEEAYSIAILLDQLLPDQEHWDIHILGTDINPQSLEKAQQAVYGEWSFRATPAWIRERYFSKTRQGNFELCAKIRQRVQFDFINLAKDAYPSEVLNTLQFDAIFCRNVLMYFSTEQARRVISRFETSLRDDGFLLVNPTETSITTFSDFKPVNYPGAIFYYKAQHIAPQNQPALFNKNWASNGFVNKDVFNQETIPKSPRAIAPPKKIKPLKPTRAIAASAKPAPTLASVESDSNSAESNSESLNTLVITARQYANQGKLDEAARCCMQAIALDKQNPALHYLLASIEQERGATAPSIQALQRTLYLDQNFVLAHFALANLRMADGRSKDAARHLNIVRTLLKNRHVDEVLIDADDMTVGRLDEIAAALGANLTEMQPTLVLRR